MKKTKDKQGNDVYTIDIVDDVLFPAFITFLILTALLHLALLFPGVV